MDNNRLTLLLITSKGQGAKSISLDYRYIKITACIIVAFILISVTSFASSFIFYKKAQNYASEKKVALELLINQSNLLNVMSSDKLVLQSRFAEIEGKLLDMQTLLDKKGINKDLALGGEYIPNDKWSLSYMDFMEKDPKVGSTDLVKSIINTDSIGLEIEVINSGLNKKCSKILKDFFDELRKTNKLFEHR